MKDSRNTLETIENLIVGAELRDQPAAHGVKALALYLSERGVPCRVLAREFRYRVHEQDGVRAHLVHALEIPSQSILIDLHQKMDWEDIIFRFEWEIRNSIDFDSIIVSVEHLEDIYDVNPTESWGYEETLLLKADIERVAREIEGESLQHNTPNHKGSVRPRRV